MPKPEAQAPVTPEAGGQPGSEETRALPTEEEMLASYEDKSSDQEAGAAGPQGEQAGEGEPKPKPVTPEDDPDGDSVFEREFKDFRMPEGVKTRLKKLTEQRNLTRTELNGIKDQLEKDYGYFKPYANEKGKAYLSTLVQFDERLEVALESNPWLGDLIRDVVIGGKAADKKKLLAALGEIESEAAGGGEEPALDANSDPRDKQLADLLKWKESLQTQQRQTAEQAQRRQQVDREKETYRSEMADFDTKNPQFKDDKNFKRLALQISASRNISYTEAAKEMAAYLGSRESGALTKLAKVDQEREGARVESPGRGGVPRKERPPVGSDEEAEQMDAYFAGLKTK